MFSIPTTMGMCSRFSCTYCVHTGLSTFRSSIQVRKMEKFGVLLLFVAAVVVVVVVGVILGVAYGGEGEDNGAHFPQCPQSMRFFFPLVVFWTPGQLASLQTLIFNIHVLIFVFFRLAERTSTVLFCLRGIEKTLLICRSLWRKDLKFTLCLIIMKFIKSRLIRDIGSTALQFEWNSQNVVTLRGEEEKMAV